MNFLDYISGLTAADARAGQNQKVKANKLTTGYETVVNGIGGNGSAFKNNDLLGVIQETVTVSVKASNGTIVKTAFTKVELDEPYYTTSSDLVTYLWFRTADISFADNTPVDVKPTSTDSQKELVPIYSVAPSGIKLRPQPNTVTKEIRIVAYGDIVGYTDLTTKIYLTTTFYKVYDQKGKAIGWVAKGTNFTSLTKPQSKALPKINTDGSTDQGYADVTDKQDPQAGNSTSSINWLKVGGFALLILGGGYLIIKGIGSLIKNKRKDGDNTGK